MAQALTVAIDLQSNFSTGLSPMPKQGHLVARALRNLGWLRAKMKGLMTEANLARKAGIWDTIGVTRLRSPKAAIITTTAYGDQMVNQRDTLVMATLATRISPLCAVSS